MAGFDEIKQAFGLDTARTEALNEEFVPDPNNPDLSLAEQDEVRRYPLQKALDRQKFAGQHRDYDIGSIKDKLKSKIQVSKQEALERLSIAKNNKGKTAEQPVIPLMEFPPVKSIQRNNPFNVEKGDDWQGLVESDSDRFMAADTPLNGLRAGYINMLAKFKEGKTVRQTIEALSPALDNNPTEKMIAKVVRMSGAGEDSVVALDDYDTIKKIGEALLTFEAPGHTYSDELINEAVDLAIEQKSTNTVGTGDIPQPNLDTFAEDFLGDTDSATGTGLLAEDTRPIKRAALHKSSVVSRTSDRLPVEPTPVTPETGEPTETVPESGKKAVSASNGNPRAVPGNGTTVQNLAVVPNPGEPNAIPPTPTTPDAVSHLKDTPTDIDGRPVTPFITPDEPNKFNSVSEGIANLSNNEELSRTLSTIPQNSELAEALASVTGHSLYNDSPVIGQYGKYAFQHEDGSWTIRQADGKTLTGLDEISAKSYNNYHQADLAGIAKGASTDEFTQAFNRVVGSFASVTEVGAAFVGKTTLNGMVGAYNYPDSSPMLIGNESYNITPSEVTSFKNIQTRLRAGKELTNAQEDFIVTDKYNAIAELDIEAAENRQDIAFHDEKARQWKLKFPVNEKDLAGAMTVVKLLGAEKGLTAALRQMILVDPGTFAKIGYDSVAYSMMLTAGGAVPRAAMYIALARSNATHAIKEFRERTGKEPSVDEILRIQIAAGAEVGAELISAGVVVKTFGRLVPGGKFAHTNDVVQAARKSTPDSILKLTIFNPVKGVVGSAASEGVSGGISSAAHAFGQGKELNITDIGIDAALEAIAMPSSVAGIIGVDIGVKATAAALDTILNPSFEQQSRESVAAHLQVVEDQLNSTVPVKVGQLAESKKKVEELTKLEAVLSVLDKDIDGNFNPENADTENEAFNKYYADFFEDGMLPAAAEAAARKRIRSEQAGFGARKAELVAELAAEASGDQVATYYANLEKQRDALNKTFEDGDFSKSGFRKKLKASEKPATAGTKIENTEFNAILKDVNTTGLEKAVGVIAELSQRVVSVSQKAKLLVENNKLIQKLKGKGAELVDKAVDKVTFFGSVGPTDADITKALANPDNTEVDNQVLKAQQRANEIARQIEEAGDNKTLEQVAADISDGAVDSKFTGIKSYQDEILSILNSDDIEKDLADRRIANLEERMSIFAENLRLKSEKFKEAQAIVSNPRNKDKAVQVVSVSDKGRRKRAVRYEIITGPVTEAQSQYATVIHKNSARLIDAVSREAAHAASVLIVTQKAKNTTFVQKAAQTKAEAAKAAEQLAVLQAVEGNIKTEQDLATTDDIETIKDPAAGAGKAKPGQPSDTKERTKLVNRIKSLTAKLAEQTPGTAAYQETFTDLEIMNDALARLSQETAATSDTAPKKQAPSTGSTDESSKGDGTTGRTGPTTKKAPKVPSDKSEPKKDEDVDSIKIGSKVQATIDGNDIFKTFATVLQIYPEEKGEIGVLLKDNSTGEQSVGLLRNLALVAKTTTPKKSGNPSAAEIQAAVDLAGIESAKASVEADQLRDVFSSTSVGVRQIFSISDPKQLLSQIARMESILTNAQEYPADRIAQVRLNLAALKIQHAYISSGGPELGYTSPENRRHVVVKINQLKKELLKLTKGTKPYKRKAKELTDAENALKVLIDKDAEIDADLAPTHSTTPSASAEDNESFESIDLGETGEEGVESNEEIRARLEGVQENESERTADNVTAETENFIESNVDNFLATISGDKASVTEKALGIEGKKFSDLVKIAKDKDGNDLPGILDIPTSAFPVSSTDSTTALENALISRGLSESAAVIMAEGYVNFATRYAAIKLDEVFKDGIFAGKKPLALLHIDKKLPPQIIFAMSIGIMQFVQRNPSNVVFRSEWQKRSFLYTNDEEISDTESTELDTLGHGYQDMVDQVGKNIASYLHLAAVDTRTSGYLDNLIVALGLAAIQIEHGPIKPNTDESRKDAALRANKDKYVTSRLHVEIHKWELDGDANKEGRKFNKNVTQEEADALNAIRNELIKNTKKPKSSEYSNRKKYAAAEIAYKKKIGERVKISVQQFKHIKLHTPLETRVDVEGKESKVEVPIKITDAEAAALVATGKAFDVDTRDQYPLQEASKDVVKTIRNSLGNVPEEVERVLGILQETPWTKAQSMDALVELLKIPGMRPVIEKMIGVVPVNPLAHEADQLSDTAANKNKLDALNEVLDAADAGRLDKFFFTFRLQNQHRILMQGKVNPQNSKVTRALLTPSVPPINYTADNIHLFKQAVAYNLGIKIDKQDLEASEAAFHTIVNNPNIQRIVAILADLGKLSDNPELGEELVELLPSIQVTPGLGGDMSIMQGLMALTHYMPDGIPPKGEFTGSFSSDVIFEIDGISNGFFMNVMQFPQYGEDTGLRRQQVGVQRGGLSEELHHDTSLDDIYRGLVDKVREGADPDIAEEHSFDPESFNKAQYKLKSDTLNELYAPLTDEDSRDLVKYPFLIFMYGGGIRSISEGVGKLIVRKMYRKLSEHIIEYQEILNPKLRAEYVRDKFTPFAEQMDILEAFVGKKNDPKRFKNKADFIASFRDGEAQKKYFGDNNLIASIGDTLAPRFDYGLNGMLGGTGPARQAVIQAGEIMYAVFKVHFDKVYALELKKTKRDSLSKKEITALIERKLETDGLPESLLDVFPQYRGPLISETERAFIDLTKTALIDEISAEQVSRFAYKNDIGKQSEAASAPRRSEFIRPGVSALIRLIINMDSAILTKVLEENPTALMLHDAFIANPETLEKISKSYGKWSLILNNETSVLSSIHAQTRKVLNLTQKLDKRDIGKIDEWLKKNAHINRFPDKEEGPKNLRKLMEEIDIADTSNDEARREQVKLTSAAGREESMQMFLAKRDNRPKNKRKAKAKAKKDKTPPVETSVPFTRGEPTAETELKKIVYKTVSKKHTDKNNGEVTLNDKKSTTVVAVLIEKLAVHKGEKQKPKKGENPIGKSSKYVITHRPTGAALPLFPHQRNDDGTSVLSKPEALALAYTLTDVLNQAGVDINTEARESRQLVKEAWTAVSAANPDEAISEFLTKNQAYKGTEANKQDTEREMGSLDDLPRDKPKTTFVKDIGASNVDALFKQFAGFSNNYYQSPAEMAEHTGVLSRILSSLSKGMDETTQIELSVENINGITQGRYDPARDAIRLSLSRQAPGSANGQSPQEVYVHELLHAMTSAALKDKPLIGRRIELLYNQVKRDMDAHSLPGYTVFLDGIANPTADDVIAAKRQYNYLFDNPKKEANKLHEFLAYAVTNKSMIKYLSGKKIELPVRNKTLLGQLQHIVDLVVDQFRALINRKYLKTEGKANAFEEMVAVVEHLTAVQSKHQSLLAKYTARTYDALSESDQKIRDFLNKQTEKLITANPSNALQQFASDFATVGAITMSDDASMHHARQVAGLQLNKTLRSIANEVGGGSLTPSMIERLLHAKVNISKARQEEERFTIKWFNGIWKSVNAADPHAMAVDVREALTDVLLRADISSLRTVGMSANAIMDTLGDRRKIDKEQKAILSRLNLKVTDKAIQYAAELGFHIASGDNYYSGAHMNAMSIAHTNFLKPTDENIALLDAYASLEAMIHLNPNKVQLVKTLSNNEFAEDGAQNGIIDMMDSHLLFKQKSRRDIFKTNPGQMVKGFIVERVDDLTSVLTGTKADAADMEKAGYTESYPLSTLTNTPGAHDTLYVSRKIPEVPDASGVMSMTNQRNMGTTLTEIFSKDPAFQDADGNPDFTAIRTEINKFDKIQKQKAKVFKKEKDLRVRPLRDQNFVITDYRVMINHENMKHLLRPDMEVQNVFAHMHSGYIDRKNTIDSDKAVVDLLVHEQSDMAKSHKDKFIDFLKDPAYADRLRKLPREVREYMESFAVNGSFLVREDIVDKVFGYKVWDFSQFKFLQTKSMGRIKRYAGVLHYMLRQIVGYGKDRIVVAMPKVVFGNMASNIYQLSMRNIPLSFTIEKIFEGISEYNKYQTDSDKLKEVTHAIESKNLPASSTEAKDAIRLQARLEANKIHKMSKAGLNSLIVEDVNMATSDGYFNRIHNSLKGDKRFQALAASTPKTLGTVATTMFMTKTSAPYQLSRKAVQLTDFLGRYVMIEHATKVKNQDFNTAMHEALTAFVLFDETLTPALEALDALGATSFISYFLRNQRASRRLVQTNPTGVGVAAAVQYATGIQTLGNVNSAWLTGDVFPNVLQLDDLFDEANNVTGLDLIRDAIDALFGD